MPINRKLTPLASALAVGVAISASPLMATGAGAQEKRPNVVMLMTDDTGWNDFGAYGGGANLGHPTPNIDRIAQEGAVFTSWYGQASCTAGRASFMTGRIPIRSALSVVVVPGDENGLTKSTPTIAEFFQKNGYGTYFSGKWHLGDQPKFYPIEHGFDEMKEFAAYYPGVYTYDDTSNFAHPWFPKFNAAYWDEYQKIVNLYEWEGVAGQPATKVARIDYDYLHEFDVRQANSAVGYIKQHAKDAKPFFMDVNFMKMHNPNIPAKAFIGKSHLGDYSDAMLELDSNIGKVIDEIRAEAPNTIVIITADNGAWQDAWPDAGVVPFRGEKGSPFEGGFRVPGIMWAPGKIPSGARYGEMMSHIDLWSTLATMVGLTPPPHGAWTDNDGKPIYFDSIDNSAYIMGKAKHSARTFVDLCRRRDLRRRSCRHWRRSREPRPAHRLEVPLHRQGHLAWSPAEPGRDWLDLQPDHGPIREIRHDVQRRGQCAHADHFAWTVRRLRQWLGSVADRGADHGVRQIHRRFPKRQALPGRGLERHEPQSAGPSKPFAFDGHP